MNGRRRIFVAQDLTSVADKQSKSRHIRHIATVASVGALLIAIFSPTSANADACGRNSVAPTYYWYTMEKGATQGKYPGHMIIGWPEDLPQKSSAHVEGPGGSQPWKTEGGVAKYLINGLPPTSYRMVWDVTCVDPIPPRPIG
jgi:hypothetical protein